MTIDGTIIVLPDGALMPNVAGALASTDPRLLAIRAAFDEAKMAGIPAESLIAVALAVLVDLIGKAERPLPLAGITSTAFSGALQMVLR